MSALLLLSIIGVTSALGPVPGSTPSGTAPTIPGTCPAGGAVLHDSNGVLGCTETSDTAPSDLLIHSVDNYSRGSQDSGNLVLRGGIDEKSGSITFGNCALENVSAIVNGNTVVCLEGTDWDATGSDTDSAADLVLCLDAVSGISAESVAGAFYVTADITTQSLSLTQSEITCSAVSNGTDGVVHTPGSFAVGNGMYLGCNDGSLPPDDGIRCDPDSNRFFLTVGGVDIMQVASTLVTLSGGIDLRMSNGKIYGSIGTIAADDATPSVINGNNFTTSANSVGTTITTFDDAVAGQVLNICGGTTDANSSVISDGGEFFLDGDVDITLNLRTCIILRVDAVDEFTELSRSAG